jgi:hypothetical protein
MEKHHRCAPSLPWALAQQTWRGGRSSVPRKGDREVEAPGEQVSVVGLKVNRLYLCTHLRFPLSVAVCGGSCRSVSTSDPHPRASARVQLVAPAREAQRPHSANLDNIIPLPSISALGSCVCKHRKKKHEKNTITSLPACQFEYLFTPFYGAPLYRPAPYNGIHHE